MKQCLFSRRSLFLGSLLAALAVAAPAQAATLDTSWCTNPLASQPFLAWGDNNWYAALPGESYDNLAATGWSLTGGATVTARTLADGRSGFVLDMPSGSTAVSSAMCIGNGYPIARGITRNVTAGSGSIAFTPYDWTTGKQLGTMQLPAKAAWALTPPVNVLPGAISGWHVMTFRFVAGGSGSYFQLYNLYVDPRMT